MRLRLSLGACLVFLGGCFEPSCNFNWTECDNDYDCGESQVCQGSCVDAERCETGGCPDGSQCVQRPAVPAGNPFTSSSPGKFVCQCGWSFDCEPYGEGGYGGSGGYGGYGGYGGTGGYGGGATGGGGGVAGGGGDYPGCLNGPPSGDTLSAERFGDENDSGGPLTGADSYVIVIPFKGKLDLGGEPLVSKGDMDVAIVNRDAGGTLSGALSLGTAGPDVLTAVGRIGGGKTGVAMSFTGSLEIGGETLDAGAGSAAVVFGAGSGLPKPFLLKSDGAVTVSSVGVGETNDYMTVAGTFSGALHAGNVILPSSGGTDGFVMSVNRLFGSVAWYYQLKGPGDQEITAALRAANGMTYVAGSFDGDTVLGGGTALSDGRDGVVLALDIVGKEVYRRVITGPDRQVVSAMALGPQGSLFVTGARASESVSQGTLDLGSGVTFDGSGLVDTYVAKLEENLDITWAKMLAGPGATGEIEPRAMAYDCADQLTIVGRATGGASIGAVPVDGYGKHDAFAVKLENGNVLWGRLMGGPEDDEATSVAPIAGDSLLVGGRFAGVATFGLPVLTSAGGDDTFLVSLRP